MDYRSYKIKSGTGLNSTIIRDITQDRDGYMWFATIHGLYRYDGYSIKQMITPDDLADGLIPDIRTVSLHRWGDRFLWVKLRGDFFSCYDLHKNKFIDYTSERQRNMTYTKGFFDKSDEVWLYGNGEGCRRITFDGKEFHITDYKSKAGGVLPSANIRFISQGCAGRVWIATDRGLIFANNGQLTTVGPNGVDICKMTILDEMEYFVTSNGKVMMYQRGHLRTMAESKIAGVRDVVPYDNGLLIITDNGTFQYQVSDHTLAHSTIASGQYSVCRDNDGNTLLWDNNGILKYVRVRDRKVFTMTLPLDAAAFGAAQRQNMITTPTGEVMVSTFGSGLYICNPEQGEVKHYLQQWGSDAVINTNYLLAIYQDRIGNIWISQEDMGLSVLMPITSKAKYLPLNSSYSPTSDFHDNCVRMLRRLTDGTVYVASFTNLLYTFDGQQMSSAPNPWGSVLSVADGLDGTRWIGTRSGLVVNNKLYRNDKTDNGSLSSDKISDICADRKGRMWIAAFGGGLDVAIPKTTGPQPSASSPQPLTPNNYIFRHFFSGNIQQREARTLHLDHHGQIWLGTGEGCFVFNPDRLLSNAKDYRHLFTNENSKMDEVHAICEDSHHRVWVAIAGIGVECYDNTGSSPVLKRVYTDIDGIGDLAVQSVVEDIEGKIYIGTNRGLSVYDEKADRFRNYLLSSTQLGNIYMENAACRLSDGRLAFGTKDGLMTIAPEMLTAKGQNHIPVITDIWINGTPINEVSKHNDAPNHTNKITLQHHQNTLTFYFSDFCFEDVRNTQYTYMLQGYDEEWSKPSSDHEVIYRNLPPGSYTLLLKAIRSDEQWDDKEAQLTIVIRPPFWLTWWAILCYVLLASAVAYAIYRQLRNMEALRNKVKIENQLTEYKIQFFTNISHELRTPLTIIRGAMESIREIDPMPSSFKQPISSMQKSVDRMVRLISQLMEFRKVQTNQLQLQVEETDVVRFLRDIYMSFRVVAEKKQVNLSFSTFANSYHLPVDRRKLDSIAHNLISNGIKYTPAKGSVDIHVRLDSDNQNLLLEVQDTGIGVPKEKQSQLFRQFMQSTFSYDSIGIGLYLSGQLARIHKGTIDFRENEEGQGSVFTLRIPSDKSVYSASDYANPLNNTFIEEAEEDSEWLKNYRETAPKPLNNRRVLIVEDDYDVGEYLETELRRFFEVVVANDGCEALRIIGEQRPDIVVSDVAMPNMNGFELTRRIKNDETMSDIPVILLTALTDETKRTRGFEVGADDYIQKPFSIRMLVMRCSQLLMQREKLKAKYASQEAAPVQAVLKEDRDRRFLDVLNQWVEGHISDPNLNVDDLATKMGYGRSTFYRKISALTGVTPNVYIRNIRMEKSKELLDEGELTISEISYKVGFSSPYYFSKCFKEHYGISPSQFKRGV
ncbi:MAG: response regulator [Prevotella sp.]|nr:response regulator [Prevotella sp.]